MEADDDALIGSDESQLVRVVRQVTLLVDAAAILYYLLTTEFITTVAHGCAVVMGMLLYRPAEWTSLPADDPRNPHQLLRGSSDSD